MANSHNIIPLHRSEYKKNEVYARRLNNWLHADAEMPPEIRAIVDGASPAALEALNGLGSALGTLNDAIAAGLSLDAVSRALRRAQLDAGSLSFNSRQFAMG